MQLYQAFATGILPVLPSSRHLDQFEAVTASRPAKPAEANGLTLKRIAKYANQGELMLVHQCEDCADIDQSHRRR
jgi:hypothetical protein